MKGDYCTREGAQVQLDQWRSNTLNGKLRIT